MAELVVENLILSARINKSLDLDEVDNAFSDVSYEPEKLPAVVFYYHNPSRVVFITTTGNMVCTGSKTEKDAINAFNETVDALKEKEIIEKTIELSSNLKSLVVSKNLNVSLPLESIQNQLSDQCTYQPSIYPWLEYQESTYSMLLFSSGIIICTGEVSLDESKNAFREIEDKLISIGCKVVK
ncbi:MAG: hypothetical protein KGY50_05070 [Candidatus Thermoplasmatota archaeon]|nr:hypothetical protein [Candidatus Thermoplasmatota archaeon]